MKSLGIDTEEFTQNRVRDGVKIGKEELCIEMYNDGAITADKAARKLNISVSEFMQKVHMVLEYK